MLNDDRRNKILSYLREHGSATVKELANSLYASDATIRRDLTDMQNLGLLKRSHGGAILLERADEISIFVRMNENAKEKEAAVAKALPYIPTGFKSVFLDSSSTILALAQRMNLTDKTVMTNNIQTAIQLSRIKGINLIIPGGELHKGTSITGSWTNTLLADFRFDLMLTSCAALDKDFSYETSINQRDVKRTVFNRSDNKILIVDHTKFPKQGTYAFEELTAFDKIIFDKLTDDVRSALSKTNLYG